MAKRGPKGKPNHLHAVGNTARSDRHGDSSGDGDTYSDDTNLEPPKKLSKPRQELWDKFIRNTPWLTEYDVPNAFIWVHLQHEFQMKPADMVASRIAQLRAIASELGLNYLKSGQKKTGPKNPNDKYF